VRTTSLETSLRLLSLGADPNYYHSVCVHHKYLYQYLCYELGAPPWSSGSMLDHRSLPPMFEYRRGHIWRLFRLWLRLITFGGRSAHLAYLVHKSGRKTSIIIIICYELGHLRGLAVACWTIDHYHRVRISAWAYLKVVSSLTSFHYLWRLLGPFSLPCAQKWL